MTNKTKKVYEKNSLIYVCEKSFNINILKPSCSTFVTIEEYINDDKQSVMKETRSGKEESITYLKSACFDEPSFDTKNSERKTRVLNIKQSNSEEYNSFVLILSKVLGKDLSNL